MAEEPTEVRELHLRWSGVEELTTFLANQFVGQVGQQNEITLTFGEVTLPVLLGDENQRAQQAREMPRHVPTSL